MLDGGTASCDFCKAGHVIRATEAEMSATRWLKSCGELGVPCLVNVTSGRFWLAWSDVEGAAERLQPSKPGDGSGTTLRFESLRAYGDEDAAITFEEEARREPVRFLRDWREHAGIGMDGDGVRVANASVGVADWYVSWYDVSPPHERRRKLRARIGDHRLSFLPSNWGRGDRWFFLSWAERYEELPGRARHVDAISGAAATIHHQLHGRKLWRLSPPTACSSECGEKTLEVIAGPGQVLSVDTNRWYHQTSLLPAEAPWETPLGLSVARHLYIKDAPDEAPTFHALDADRNGLVSAAELVGLVSHKFGGPESAKVSGAEFADLIKFLDRDGDGQLNEQEYAVFRRARLAQLQWGGDGGGDGDDEPKDNDDDHGSAGGMPDLKNEL